MKMLMMPDGKTPWPVGKPIVTTDPLQPIELTPAQMLMVEDGFPPGLFRSAEERRAWWKGKRLTSPGLGPTAKKEQDPSTAKLRAELEAKAKAEAKQQKRARREAAIIRAKQKPKPATEQESDDMRKTKTKSTSNARTPAGKKVRHPKQGPKAQPARKRGAKPERAASSAPKREGGVKPGSKLALIVGLLTRPQGCTTADVLKATDWPSVSMPQQAKSAGLVLRKEKKDGVTVYRADPPKAA